MLLTMRAYTEGCRALGTLIALENDVAVLTRTGRSARRRRTWSR
jgi:hypothetical protein